MTDIVTKAYEYAKEKHGETLDDDGVNFFYAHPVQVAEIIMSVSDDDNLLAAAYLHDVVEDTPVTEDELRKEFGDDITNLVMEVTHEGRKDTHGYYFPRLKTRRGAMLKFADRLSNLSRLNGPKWEGKRAERYVAKSINGFPTEPPLRVAKPSNPPGDIVKKV